MWLSETSIKRPVLAIVMSCLLILFGLIGLSRLPVREYPDIDPPVVSISTVYPGSNPEVVERTVTEILEDELTSIEGIKTLISQSREELSQITIEFNLKRNVELAAQDVRDRVSRVRGRLPDDIDEPVVAKQDADAQAVMWISLSGKNFTPLEISDYADRYIVDRLQTVPGVSRVIIGGQREYAMRIWLDTVRMAARGVTVLDVQTALRAENVEIPSGRVEGVNREFIVRTRGDLSTVNDFNRLIVKEDAGGPVYLEDVARIALGSKNERSRVRYLGAPAVGLGIVRQAKSNVLDVAKGVKQKLTEIQTELPRGMRMEVAFDTSLFIERSLHEVRDSLYIAGILVVLVIGAFLGNIRSAFIPAASIPVSIIATFGILDMLGFSVNTLTLLALILAIGLVVDDTIVVLENIVRHMEMGKSPLAAARDGTNEIGFAVLATTWALVAVFIPLGYMTGVVGRLFSEFAIAVAGSVVVSAFVSLTLTPVMCAKLLKSESYAPVRSRKASGWLAGLRHFADRIKGSLDRIAESYGTALQWAMDHRPQVLTLTLGMLLLSGVCYMFMMKDFLPVEDRGTIFTVVQAPEGATLAYTARAVQKAEDVYRTIPEVKHYFSVVALSAEGVGQVNNGFLFVSLKPWEERHRKQQKIVETILPQMMSIPSAFVFPINPPSGPLRGFSKPLEVVLQGFDIQALSKAGDDVANQLRQVPGVINVDTDLKLNKPQLTISVDREKAALLGVSVREIATTLQILLGGQNITTFENNSKRYDVMLQLPDTQRMTPDIIQTLTVRSRSGEMIPLGNLVHVNEATGPRALNHYDRLRSVTINASLLPFLPLGQAMQKTEKIAKQVLSGTSQMSMRWAGESRELKETQNTVLFMFLVSLLVVYLVLSAQFESFLHPLIILVTVPLAVCGALVTLFLTGNSLNVYSQIGMILLIGLVTKNGILIVEYANQRLRADDERNVVRAVVEAAKIRFRPIVMTSLATVLGALPIAMAWGAGAESRQPLGLAVVGGMILSTGLTLFVVPVVYAWMNRHAYSTRNPG